MKDDSLFHILREIENPDGTVDMEFEITDEFIEHYKKSQARREPLARVFRSSCSR